MSICQIEAICFVIGPLLRAWECFSEEIRDTLGSCASTTHSKSKITCSQWKIGNFSRLETRIFSSQVQICWIAEWLNACTFKCCCVFWDCKLPAGSACRGGSLSEARGRISPTVSSCLFVNVSIISLQLPNIYIVSGTDFWHEFYLYVAWWPSRPLRRCDRLQLSWWEKSRTVTHRDTRQTAGNLALFSWIGAFYLSQVCPVIFVYIICLPSMKGKTINRKLRPKFTALLYRCRQSNLKRLVEVLFFAVGQIYTCPPRLA